MENNLTFEAAIARLDEIVKTLERGDAPLEDALVIFEEGITLVKNCGKLLDKAEQKVVKIQKGDGGEPMELPFDSEEG